MPWCQKCDIALELACSEDLDKLSVAARSIAMVAASVPVFGTTVNFVINTAVSLTEGEPIGQALLDGIGGTLPIHPASGMAFNASVAIGWGKRFDQIATDALPFDKRAKTFEISRIPLSSELQ